jgi:hypothetical protein
MTPEQMASCSRSFPKRRPPQQVNTAARVLAS